MVTIIGTLTGCNNIMVKPDQPTEVKAEMMMMTGSTSQEKNRITYWFLDKKIKCIVEM
ncbi:MAG: hypothetical protein KKA65_03770 [Nanoarchaeota archaeon]|nr:hypothetical protein [Nanoarchaeota archaeon]MBU4352227.1 hypothetical protein [Nanoarchaeota archaeon]MBU4456595.1 hypothetical protein [Nanoarchaeota archaeon]MCG2719824.1 hypothetical protein [Nanoarchaeota archaeon]